MEIVVQEHGAGREHGLFLASFVGMRNGLGGLHGAWQKAPPERIMRSAEGTEMKSKIAAGLAVLALMAGIAPAAAQTVEFTVINNSSLTLLMFHTTPSNENSWGDDLLGDTGVLEAGYQATATIGDGSDQCLYDFKFVMEDGTELVEPAVDICSLDSYTLND
jgi:hypothetical protein